MKHIVIPTLAAILLAAAFAPAAAETAVEPWSPQEPDSLAADTAHHPFVIHDSVMVVPVNHAATNAWGG